MKSMRTTYTKVTNPNSSSSPEDFTPRAREVAGMLHFLKGHVSYHETLSNGKKVKKAANPTKTTRTIYM